ncbi:unnamed protein product [Ascophyllum nodosum]
MALFHVVYSSIYLVVGVFCLLRMYKARNVLEIRSRSVYLVLTLGICLVIDFALNIHVECVHLFGWPTNIFATHMIFFFTIFTIGACYTSRVIRLGVSFSPSIKRAIPWIMSEKLLVIASLCIGVLSVLIPGHYFVETGGGDYLVDFVLTELDVVWKCQVGLVAIQLVLLPIMWVVDDIYRVSWELGIIVILGLVDVVIVRLSALEVLTPGAKEYINSSNVGLIWTSAVFGLSVVDPLRRLSFNPMARSLAAVAPAKTRGCKRLTTREMLDLDTNNIAHPCPGKRGIDDDPDGIMTERMDTSSTIRSMNWSYDKMASVPKMAEAFREFAWRALCQESVMFLEEVSKYELGNYEIARPIMSQFQAFGLIVRKFVVDGSNDEINLSSRDKSKILDVYKGGTSLFFTLQEEERRLIFNDAYQEIRSMLEDNLVHRFMCTEGFREMYSTDAVAKSPFNSSHTAESVA